MRFAILLIFLFGFSACQNDEKLRSSKQPTKGGQGALTSEGNDNEDTESEDKKDGSKTGDKKISEWKASDQNPLKSDEDSMGGLNSDDPEVTGVKADDFKNLSDLISAGNPNQKASIKGSQKNIYLEVATHHDAFNVNHGKKFPVADIMQSSVAKLALDAIKGNVLPVTQFALDDVAILVKPSQTISSVLDAKSRFDRTINIPDVAVLLYNGNDPDFASGSVDSGAKTTYRFQGKSVVLPGGKQVTLKEVYNLGMPLIAHDAVQISKLIDLGFVNENKELEFKIFHVSHGHGEVSMRFEIESCDE